MTNRRKLILTILFGLICVVGAYFAAMEDHPSWVAFMLGTIWTQWRLWIGLKVKR